MMVGANISDEQLGSIADRTLSEADDDQDGYISFDEFSKVFVSLCLCPAVSSCMIHYALLLCSCPVRLFQWCN